ncbi:MAG: TonB family protein, partial [Bacteroidota bacterium]|jgi:protein TonB
MEIDKNINSQNTKDWLDILFQYRNKAYGAYVLRKEYVKTLTKSQLFTLAILLLVFGGSYAGKLFSKAIEEKKVKKNVDVVMQAPPPLENEPEPPPPPKLPDQIKVEKFTPPEIVEDNEVRKEDEVKPPDEIKGNVGTVEVEGTIDAPPVDAGPGEIEVDQNKVYNMAEITKQAEYAGLGAFLEKNLEYPDYERDAEIQGTVKIGFTIEKDGSISNVRVVKSVSQGLDDEALRVVKMMPRWTPAEYNGAKVRLNFVLPIVFTL